MLTIGNLNVSYGNIQALRDVSLSVEAGEIVTLIGANGAGKSTLLKVISRVLHSSSGDISFFNQNVKKLSATQVVKLGISHAPEGRRIFPEMTVLENLEMGAYTRGASYKEDLQRVYRIFPILEDRKHQLGATLSGGEQQMLTIGRALMARPKLLLLDEPSMGLAPTLVQTIFQIIKEINMRGRRSFWWSRMLSWLFPWLHGDTSLRQGKLYCKIPPRIWPKTLKFVRLILVNDP
jgi:branched-chain amino acid transport system ATP-binding protein